LLQGEKWFLTTRTLYVVYLALSSACFALTLAGSIVIGRRLLQAKMSGKRWCGMTSGARCQ